MSYLRPPAQPSGALLPMIGLHSHRKRSRVPSPSDESSTIYQGDVLMRVEKRRRIQDYEGKPTSIMVHRVYCTVDVPGHDRHARETLYLDEPRLYQGDNKASPLRGREPITCRLEDFIEGFSNISFLVMRSYDCTQYHETIRDDFKRLPLPQTDWDSAAELRPYFYQLQHDGMVAVAREESLEISHALKTATKKIERLELNLFAGLRATLKPPYLQVYHTRTRMRFLANEVLDEEDAVHVLLLLDYIERSFGLEYREADELFGDGLVTRQHLDKLFGPSEVVVRLEDGEPVGYRTTACPSPIPGNGPVSLKCYNWSFNGTFQREETILQIPWPAEDQGPVAITDLSIYPLRFNPDGQLEQTLRDRGTMFWACRERKFLGYVTPTSSFEIKVSNPRYMVDMATYRELHNKENDQKSIEHGDLGQEAMNSDDPPDDTFVLLLPPRIRGFGLHDKKWRSLLVKHLRPITWNKKAFEMLVLDAQKKEVIEAMVRIHVSSNMSTDVIEGKGNGLIILLHGGPGTGKTLTAESVAELAERPLYRVTCGDIGTDPESVEKYLESVLYIGRIWKAVLLLDESDVFLEEREKTDLQRNALVSVFLRALEYYEGILILTSNRGRWEIWNNSINLLRRQQEGTTDKRLADGERINFEELRDKIDMLATESLNGRQIRNAITTARQLARFRERPLGYLHIEQTIRIANEFEAYVEKTHGHSAGDFARAAGVRLE
ncbi:p-loop containing nucleoside triphosphate hydrolase [Fusarium sporotrichioides]|uniref:p-loop containing nucleoside triphosphate hydrolase n=1 Tax=Fusarium sporotrichioides TaxID=5514 RepID=A0A395SJC9_FUSSP|nr:p-loop containing nucleoside triphosphate hydrolase [Fusarium sporotrichioides]